MAKNRKNKPRAARSARRRPRGRRGRSISARIPLQPFNKQLVNTVLRGSHTVGFQNNSLLVVDFTSEAIIAAYPQLFQSFREIKIQKVRVWLQTLSGTSSPGVISMIVAPKDEINSKATYDVVASTPGSITGKAFSTLHGVYFPTEPDERNWFLHSTNKHLFSVCFMAQGMASNALANELKIQIVWDAHVRMRGLTSSATAFPKLTTRSLSDDGFDIVSRTADVSMNV